MSPNEQCHSELALLKVRRIPSRWSGHGCRGEARRPGRMGPDERTPLAAPWDHGTGNGVAHGWQGPATSAGPYILQEERGGRGGRLEDARLSESSQSTLTR